MTTLPDEAVKAAKDVLYYANPNDVERALAVVKEYLTTRALSSPDYADADHAQARDVLARFRDYVIEGITAGTIMRGGEHHNPIWQDVASVLHADAGKVDGDGSFQCRVEPWMLACFGEEISNDKLERCDRFIEEALELVQAIGYSAGRANALVDYVFNREIGEPHQEVGGVMVTLAALCLASGLDMDKAGEDELARIWTKIEKIRAKRATKPTGSALPIVPHPSGGDRHGE